MKKMKLLIILFFISTNFVSAFELEGRWLTTDRESIIEIYITENGLYQGQLIWTMDQSDKAKNYHGAFILIDFIQANDRVFRGKVNDPEKQHIYSCTITMKNNNELELLGYIGIPLFGRTEYWTRVVSE